jgi:hypothetical protein
MKDHRQEDFEALQRLLNNKGVKLFQFAQSEVRIEADSQTFSLVVSFPGNILKCWNISDNDENG